MLNSITRDFTEKKLSSLNSLDFNNSRSHRRQTNLPPLSSLDFHNSRCHQKQTNPLEFPEIPSILWNSLKLIEIHKVIWNWLKPIKLFEIFWKSLNSLKILEISWILEFLKIPLNSYTRDHGTNSFCSCFSPINPLHTLYLLILAFLSRAWTVAYCMYLFNNLLYKDPSVCL